MGSWLTTDDITSILGGRVPEEELAKVLETHLRHLPSLLGEGGGRQNGEDTASPLFNALVLAGHLADPETAILAAALDSSSMVRLCMLRGGETVKVPTVDELVRAHLVLLGAFSVRNRGNNPFRAFGSVNKALSKMGLEKMTLEEFQTVLTDTTKKIMKGIRRSHGGSKSILEQLQGSLNRMDMVLQGLQGQIERLDDPKVLLDAYANLTSLARQVEGWMQTASFFYMEEAKEGKVEDGEV